MEVVEEFLIQDEGELDIFPKNLPIMLGDVNCNLDEYYNWWDVEFSKPSEFESEMQMLAVMEEKEDYFVFQREQLIARDKQELLQTPTMQKDKEEEKGQQLMNEDNVEEDEYDTATDYQKKSDEANSKNLQSERNRRKRLNQQLFTLRSLVPNITKMDKISILADALAYLRSLLQDIEKELEKNSSLASEPSSSIAPGDDASLPVQLTIPPYERCAAHPAITQMNAQMLHDTTFVLEIGCNKAIGAVCQVQRSIEMLGVEITCSSVNQLDHETMITTAFIRVKKRSLVTPEKLLSQLELNARQLSLHLPSDSA